MTPKLEKIMRAASAEKRRPSTTGTPEEEGKRDMNELYATLNIVVDDKSELATLLLPESLDSLDFDVFLMNKYTKGVPITHLTYSILYDVRYCLMDIFDLDKSKISLSLYIYVCI